MILFDLKCGAGHVFEVWFKDGASYDRQAAAGDVACPLCGDGEIEKAPMAPRIAKRAKRDAKPADPAKPDTGDTSDSQPMVTVNDKVRGALAELRRTVEENCDYVGGEFAEEARKIYYGEVEKRDIYGESSEEEARELSDEGVPVGRIPWLPRRNS